MAKQVAVCLSFDFDAFSVWLGTFRMTSPSALSRGASRSPTVEFRTMANVAAAWRAEHPLSVK